MAQRYDAGVRSGEQVAKDMIAMRIGPDMRMAVVVRRVFRKRPVPKSPQDLIGHNCIDLRLPSHGGVYAWKLEKSGRVRAGKHGAAASCQGRLRRVVEDWCRPDSGYHWFYPSRRQSAALLWSSMHRGVGGKRLADKSRPRLPGTRP